MTTGSGPQANDYGDMYRAKVHGGWLYRWGTSHGASGMSYVPDPIQWQEFLYTVLRSSPFTPTDAEVAERIAQEGRAKDMFAANEVKS